MGILADIDRFTRRWQNRLNTYQRDVVDPKVRRLVGLDKEPE